MCPAATQTASKSRQRWVIRGQVQGVGYRPFVYRLAHRFGLSGSVKNDTTGVTIEAQGSAAALERFSRALEHERPPLALIDDIESDVITPERREESDFHIIDSSADPQRPPDVGITVDAAVCPDCLAELLDVRDRRSGYGLINCTNCGPRFSIIQHVPYDRPNTTMKSFEMCQPCGDEYTDPLDRRFHAQPIACHACGPTVELVDSDGRRIGGDPIEGAAERLASGRIIAIKGLGGFHLAVRADDEIAVARLRRAKQRDHKPFALMCRSIEAAAQFATFSSHAITEMRSPRCPIVLAPRRADVRIAAAVAPDSHRLGLMLPYTPIHHLLFAALDSQIDALVMTSGNLTDEPLVIDNAEAIERIGGMCDAILWHDRPIERCVDDSVLIDAGDALIPIRRSRGYTPAALPLPRTDIGGAPTYGLCVGGELKNTVAVVRDDHAVLGQHLGDLTHPLAHDYFKKAIADLLDLYQVAPEWIAHDLHPVYLSTAYARTLAEQWGVPLIGIQHHHAHAASVMAEHDVAEPALAIVCDGVGYGTDGTIWGGELLRADLLDFERLAHLRPLRLAGGDAAAKDTRRCALALMHQVYGDAFDRHPTTQHLIPDDTDRAMLTRMISRNVNCSASTGAGRLFDGVAALLGLCGHNQYEAQAAMRLEAAASRWPGGYRSDPEFDLSNPDHDEIDCSPLVDALLQQMNAGRRVEQLAAMFHEELAHAWASMARHWADHTGIRVVALSGGVFCNRILTQRLTELLSQSDLRVLTHHKVPPNDGGLAFGQAAIAAARVDAGLINKEVASCV